MNRILVDIRDFQIGALVLAGNRVCHEASLDCRAFSDSTSAGNGHETVESILHATGAKGPVLSSILAKISRDAAVQIQAGYLLVPDSHLLQESVTLPKISTLDAQALIERKLNPQGDIKLHITPAEESDRKQTWNVDYLPSELTRSYQDAFSTAGIKLQGITTSSHTAVRAINKCFPALIDHSHILLDLSINNIEGFYISGNWVCRQEHFSFGKSEAEHAGESEDQSHERALFRIIDGIFRIMDSLESGSHEERVNLLLCGNHPHLLAIAAELTEVTGLNVFTADRGETSVQPGANVLLNGYAAELIAGEDTDYLQHEQLQEKALSIKSGIFIYLLTVLLAVLFIFTGEIYHKRLSAELVAEKKKLVNLRSVNSTALKQAEVLVQLQRRNSDNGSFYTVFRDLANNLPDGIYLDSISIKRDGDQHLLELQTVTSQSSAIHTNRLLTRLDRYLSSSRLFVMQKDPVITVTGNDRDKSVQIKFSCGLVIK